MLDNTVVFIVHVFFMLLVVFIVVFLFPFCVRSGIAAAIFAVTVFALDIVFTLFDTIICLFISLIFDILPIVAFFGIPFLINLFF